MKHHRFRYVGLTTSVAQLIDDQSGLVTRNIGTGWGGERMLDWTGTGSNIRYYGSNAHHDTVWTASSTGTVSATLRYDPFGRRATERENERQFDAGFRPPTPRTGMEVGCKRVSPLVRAPGARKAERDPSNRHGPRGGVRYTHWASVRQNPRTTRADAARA